MPFFTPKILLTRFKIRLLNALDQHIFSRPKNRPWRGPQVLFQPLITSSHAPLLECDYNIHKSNSTYFTDLDVSRCNLVACLFKDAIAKLRTETVEGESGRLGIILGSVTCSFRKEIKPYERFEVWSRVLYWDRKWLYIVSHFLKKGAIKPKGYTLQNKNSKNWLKGLISRRHSSKKDSNDGPSEKESITTNGTANISNGTPTAPGPNKAIFASALSRYVFKKGRLTISPERVLQYSSLLPPKPKDEASATAQTSPTDQPSGAATSAPASVEALIDSSLEAKTASLNEAWDWNRIEQERVRGMKIAQLLADMDGLHDEFSGEQTAALGEYRDLFWT